MKLLHQIPDKFLEPEGREIVVRKKTKQLWAVLLDMLKSFDEVCKKYNIKYYLDSGSLLGAVRHKGFIPWDDDLDVIMLREEYDKLCKVSGDEFVYPLFFQTEYSDPGSAKGHAQIRRSDTTGILKSEMIGDKAVYKFNQGIFLDVFVLDAVPDDPDELAKFRRILIKDKARICWFQYLIYSRNSTIIRLSHPGSITVALAAWWCRFKKYRLGVDELRNAYERFETDVQQYNGKGMCRVANFSVNPHLKDSQIFDRKIYEDSSEYEFEGSHFTGPKDYDTVLRGYYGDWHEHVVGGGAHGGMLIDTERPYTEYLRS